LLETFIEGNRLRTQGNEQFFIPFSPYSGDRILVELDRKQSYRQFFSHFFLANEIMEKS
jgi:hypothetical protein